jgi:hypothetical protein
VYDQPTARVLLGLVLIDVGDLEVRRPLDRTQPGVKAKTPNTSELWVVAPGMVVEPVPWRRLPSWILKPLTSHAAQWQVVHRGDSEVCSVLGSQL